MKINRFPHIKRIVTMIGGSVITALLLLTVVLSLLIVEGGCIPSILSPVTVQITHFAPASGTYYPGDAVISNLRLKNTGDKPWTFWVGHSVWDQIGQRYDVTSHQVKLDSGVESNAQSKIWYVPASSSCISGDYKLAIAVWDTSPEIGNATQLTYREKKNSFQILRYFEQFNDFNERFWNKSNHRLEKSYLDPNNVSISNGNARIRIPAGTLNGGEFGSKNYLKYGTYRARLLLSPVKRAITGFFLYYGIGGVGDEIDIEMYNDDGWQIAFTTWLKGAVTNTVKKALKFDPSAEYHEYRIDFYPKQISFFVDGKPLQEFDSGLPVESMRLLVNTWFPEWLHGIPPATDEYTYVDWVQY